MFVGSSLRASRTSSSSATALLRTVTRSHVVRRNFIMPTAARKADFVQDLYLRELKAYKAPPMKPNDSEGHVQVFSMPKAPRSPEESDLAAELKAYEDSEVEVEGQDSYTTTAATAGGATAVLEEEDWFEEDEEDEPAAKGH